MPKRLIRPGVPTVMQATKLFGGGAGGTCRYHFGPDSYVTCPAWQTLGDPGVYKTITYKAENDQGYVTDGLTPLTQWGKVGANNHNGFIWDFRLTDNSPIQDTTVKGSSLGTLPEMDMTDGVVSFDWVGATDGDLLVGFLTVAGGVLQLSADATNLKVDGSPYAGATINADQHYRIALETTGGMLTTIEADKGMQNLLLDTTGG